MSQKRKNTKKSGSKKSGKNAPTTPRLVDVGELHRTLKEGAVQLVDVRTGMEFAGGHIEGSLNIPLSALESRASTLQGPVWVICRTGNRSATAATMLRKHGLDVTDVRGGTVAWAGQGYPLEGSGNPLAQLAVPLLASLTLGLAPFAPEPHLIGKLRWLAGGGVGMGIVDYFDLVMHGLPWVWLLYTLVGLFRKK